MRYLIILLALSGTLQAQDELPKPSSFQHTQSIQLELGGHGFAYSLNYEYLLQNGPRFKLAAQIGGSYLPDEDLLQLQALWLPALATGIYSFGKHHVELGGGFVFMPHEFQVGDRRIVVWDGLIASRLGYRYQRSDSRWIFRVAVTPFMESYGPEREYFDVYFFGGVAVGYAF